MDIKGFVIAGTNSGCGKTTISLAFMEYFTRKGYTVAPFKTGPDFIDPGHHSRITGTFSRNLDGWMLSKAYNLENFNIHSNVDIAIVEGVMGLYDGYEGQTEKGSTAEMAKWIDLPVVLVVNAKSMVRSAAALVQGFENFDKDLKFCGLIFNNIGSKNHFEYLTSAIKGNVKAACLGGIPRNPDIEIHERHLGLVTDDEYILKEESINKLADLIEDHIDVESLLNSIPEINHDDEKKEKVSSISVSGKKDVRIGVARDKAFCFYYQENLELLKHYGADIVFFSPVEDKALPEDLHGIYLGGGYPELFAEKLSQNSGLLNEIKKMSDMRLPIYGECGGFMYLCNDIRDLKGDSYSMTGCFPFSCRMLNRLKTLGYREIRFQENTFFGNKSDTVRGHEFHYSEITDLSEHIETIYRVSPRLGHIETPEGYIRHNTLGSYIHLHFGSNIHIPENFVNAGRRYKTDENTV